MDNMHMATHELDKVIQMIDLLSPRDRQKLTQYLMEEQKQPSVSGSVSDAISDGVSDAEDDSFTEAEIDELMTITPKSTREIIAEGRKSGAIGSWADRGIEDPVEWLAQQRAKRKKYHW